MHVRKAMRRKGAMVVLPLVLLVAALAIATTGLGSTGAKHAKAAGPITIGKGGGFGEIYRAKVSTLAKTLFQARLLPVTPAARNIALAGLGRSERPVNQALALQYIVFGAAIIAGMLISGDRVASLLGRALRPSEAPPVQPAIGNNPS